MSVIWMQDPPVLEPREVTGLPRIRALRCGGHHMLASSVDGDVFVWGCGLTHQLGNRPRDVSNPVDIDDEPEDELRPYRLSSKQLEKRFVMIADGGAQHTVELAWDSSYSKMEVSAEPAPEVSVRAQQEAEAQLLGGVPEVLSTLKSRSHEFSNVFSSAGEGGS